jgi:hypothetical protein
MLPVTEIAQPALQESGSYTNQTHRISLHLTLPPEPFYMHSTVHQLLAISKTAYIVEGVEYTLLFLIVLAKR